MSPALLMTVDLCLFTQWQMWLSLYFVISLTPFLSFSYFCFSEAANRLGVLQRTGMGSVHLKDEELFASTSDSEDAESNLKRYSWGLKI